MFFLGVNELRATQSVIAGSNTFLVIIWPVSVAVNVLVVVRSHYGADWTGLKP